MICNMCLYKGTLFDEEFSLGITKSRGCCGEAAAACGERRDVEEEIFFFI